MALERAVIAFGANLGDRLGTLQACERLLATEIGTVLQRSKFYENPALLLPNENSLRQPGYLNAAWLVSTALEASIVLEKLLSIEQRLGRVRGRRWAARNVDLDLIAQEAHVIDYQLATSYGTESNVLTNATLILPHPEMHKRSFVLQPLCDLWPEWKHPILQKTAAELLKELNL